MRRFLFAVATFIAGLVLVSSADAHSQAAVCGRDGKRAALELAPGEDASVDFGRSRGRKESEIELRATGCEFEPNTPLQPQHRQFRRGGAAIPADQIDVVGLTERRALIVTLGVASSGVDPGAYKGKIIVDDPRVEPFSFDATARLQYDRWYFLALLMLPVLALGTFLIWTGTTEPLLPKGLKSTGKFLLAIGAAAGAFYGTYWKDPVWGSDGWQVATLAGVVLAAYMASVTAAAGVGGAGQKLR